MSGIIQGERPLEIGEVDDNRVFLQQTDAQGQVNRIELQMQQVETLDQWLTAWLEESKEGLVNV